MTRSEIEAILAGTEGVTPGKWLKGCWGGRCHKKHQPHPGRGGNDPCVYTPEIYDGTGLITAEGETLLGSDYDGMTAVDGVLEYIARLDPQTVSALCTALLESMDRVERHEAALKPFADAITRYEAHWATETGDQRVEDDSEKVSYLGWLGNYFDLVTLGDFRATRKSLGGSNERLSHPADREVKRRQAMRAMLAARTGEKE